MYVDPFWMGVFVTIAVGLVALFGWALLIYNRGKK
jgi:hypothetical protein